VLASAPLMWNLKNWKLKTDELKGRAEARPPERKRKGNGNTIYDTG
jgi:hypothetical protein